MKYGEATLREISNQPKVWQRCLETLETVDMNRLTAGKQPSLHQWIFVGCGTSYYLAQAAAASFTALTGAYARAVPASEILLFPGLSVSVENTAIFPVLISRSGRTTEVLQVAEILRRRGIEFLGVTCDGNELSQLSSRMLRLPVIEESTVMTSSFTSMLIALQYLAGRIAGQREFLAGLHMLPEAVEGLLSVYTPQIEQFSQRSFEDAACLAQGALYPIASETALKVMESSSSYAQFFHALEFRHGPKSIVSEKVLVGALISETGYAEESAVLLEMKNLGGCTLAIANRVSPELRASADLAIELALPIPEIARLVAYVVWGQLLGSYMGLRKGLNPDSPRHLSRVVTLAE